MPNTGASEAQIASHTKNATKSPKALLLGAIAASRPSPTAAAKTAEELGLSKADVQSTRWLAMQKRGRTQNEFLQELSDTLAETPKQEVERMPKTIVGRGYFVAKTKPLLDRLVRDLIECGVYPDAGLSDSRCPQDIQDLNVPIEVVLVSGTLYVSHESSKTGMDHKFKGINISGGKIGCGRDGLSNLDIYIHSSEVLGPVRKFANAWEKRSQELKTSRDASVTIVKEYA